MAAVRQLHAQRRCKLSIRIASAAAATATAAVTVRESERAGQARALSGAVATNRTISVRLISWSLALADDGPNSTATGETVCPPPFPMRPLHVHRARRREDSADGAEGQCKRWRACVLLTDRHCTLRVSASPATSLAADIVAVESLRLFEFVGLHDKRYGAFGRVKCDSDTPV
jgi:hypothetical protein